MDKKGRTIMTAQYSGTSLATSGVQKKIIHNVFSMNNFAING